MGVRSHRVRAVIWDIGNVLVRWDPRHLYEPHFDDKDELEYFLTHIVSPAWNLEQDRGRTFAEAVAMLSKEHPHYADLIELFDSQWINTLGGEIEGCVELVHELRGRGVPLFAITNFSAEKWRVFCAAYDFTRHLEDVVVSGEEGLLKPDPRIFKLALERFALAPEQAVFIDDRAENVEAARAHGIVSHHFTDPAPLRRALAGYGLLG